MPLSTLKRTPLLQSNRPTPSSASGRSVHFQDQFDFSSQEDVFPSPNDKSTPLRRPFAPLQPILSSTSPSKSQFENIAPRSLLFAGYHLSFAKMERLKLKYSEPATLVKQIVASIEEEAISNGQQFDRFNEELLTDVVKKVLSICKPIDFFDCVYSSAAKKLHDSVRHKKIYARKKSQLDNQNQ